MRCGLTTQKVVTVGAIATLLAAACAAVSPPTIPLAFSTHRTIAEAAGKQAFDWRFDYGSQREQMTFSQHPIFPPNTTMLYVYHGKWIGPGTKCMDTNDCATIYTWGPGTPCTGLNTSNTMNELFDWLTHDEFTNESAVFLGRDARRSCDVWMHVSTPEFPKDFNQTACVAAGETGSPAPVYMHYRVKGEPAGFESDAYSAFKPGSDFPPGTFEPGGKAGVTCPVVPQAQGHSPGPSPPLLSWEHSANARSANARSRSSSRSRSRRTRLHAAAADDDDYSPAAARRVPRGQLPAPARSDRSAVTSAPPIPLIIDTDTALTVPGAHDVDDDFAVLLALAHPQVVRQSVSSYWQPTDRLPAGY